MNLSLNHCLFPAVLALALHALPAAQSSPVRIMPLGDSLTSSTAGHASYRYCLWQKLISAGYNVDFVGTRWGVGDGTPATPSDFDQDHEGHPSATTDDILYCITDVVTQTHPDVVLLVIGSTDFERKRPVAAVVKKTNRIIAAIRAVNPQVVTLVALLPPAADQRDQVKAYNSAILNQAPKWSQPESPVKVVDLWSNFNPARDTFDGQHPNTSGEKKFANKFYIPLVKVLNKFRSRN